MAALSAFFRRLRTMKMNQLLKAIIPVTGLLFLCGCPTTHTHYLAQPERVAVQGAYVHAASKITMPENIGDFQRNLVFRYDADAFDVSAGYNLLGISNQLAATVYVYPAPSLTSFGSPPDVVAGARAHLTQGEFERLKQEIQHAHPGAIIIEQRNTVQTDGGQPHPGKLAIFEYEGLFGGSRIPLRSRLYVFCFVHDKWAVEYRFTYPKAEDPDREIHEFIQKWNWSGGGP